MNNERIERNTETLLNYFDELVQENNKHEFVLGEFREIARLSEKDIFEAIDLAFRYAYAKGYAMGSNKKNPCKLFDEKQK